MVPLALLQGAMLIAVYIIIAMACWFNPETDKPQMY
jgi:hypothetical protein